jgi:hypothetical protein
LSTRPLKVEKHKHEDGNKFAYPSDESGQAHFRKMLETTAQRLTQDEINSLIEALRDGQR